MSYDISQPYWICKSVVISTYLLLFHVQQRVLSNFLRIFCKMEIRTNPLYGQAIMWCSFFFLFLNSPLLLLCKHVITIMFLYNKKSRKWCTNKKICDRTVIPFVGLAFLTVSSENFVLYQKVSLVWHSHPLSSLVSMTMLRYIHIYICIEINSWSLVRVEGWNLWIFW